MEIHISETPGPAWQAYRAAFLTYARLAADRSATHEQIRAALDTLDAARAAACPRLPGAGEMTDEHDLLRASELRELAHLPPESAPEVRS